MPWTPRASAAIFLCLLPALAQSPAFDVVSIKPNASRDVRAMRLQVLPGGRLVATDLPLLSLIVFAYKVPINPSERLTGVPEWAVQERYDIAAKAPEGAVPLALPPPAFRARMRAMVQVLLADRFKMKVRHESRLMTVWELTVAKNGPKMTAAAIPEEQCPSLPPDAQPCHQFNGGMGRGLHAKAVNMDDLAGYIENWTDHPVLDKTGLTGLYAMDTEGWIPMNLPPPPIGNVPNPAARPNGDGDMSDPARPTIFNVLARLGLELKQDKAPVDCYIVEHIERPAEN
jgi:uncharacterized protein (TIGR03435 family)